jgi:tRNA(Arg) A34 adenosine deaminase TadA
MKDSALKNFNYSILIIRILKNTETGLSHPCSICAEALEKSVFQTIYYTTDTGFAMISTKNISRHHISSSQRIDHRKGISKKREKLQKRKKAFLGN